MSASLTISLDAMGGDKAPDMVVEGANLALDRFSGVRFILHGDQERLEPLLDRFPRVRAASELRHAPQVVTNDAKPSIALRSARQSSMRLAVDCVAAGEAGGVVSAGNTGAYMAMAKIVLKTLPGIHRPAIATFYPTRRGASVMLDLGANLQCDVANLVEFAVMGEVFARIVLGMKDPSIGLLNVGAEDLKGHESLQKAAAILRSGNPAVNFHGFVEGDDIPAGTVDVVVTDGFTGNIALKCMEGTARNFASFMRDAFQSSWLARVGYLCSRPAIERLRNLMDPRRYNGAIFLGLDGIAVKSHGGTDGLGFANAIGVAINMCTEGANDKIKEELSRVQLEPDDDTPTAAAL